MNPVERLQFGWFRRVPVILQSDAAECGLACLAMLASYHRHHTDPSSLRRRFGFSLKGATLKDLIGIADQLGLASRPLRCELDELPRLRTPCILHWDLNHFVVLKSVGRTAVVIHDPAEGVRRLSFDQVSRHFTGVALEVTPAGGFETAAPLPRVRIRALLGQVIGMRRSLGQLLLLAFAIEVFQLLSPLFLSLTVDHAIVSADRKLLLTLALAFGLLLVLQTAISALRGWMLIALGASLKVQSRTNLFSHLVALPAGYFETRHVADVLSRFDSQETILQALTTDLVVAMLDGVMCCITLAVMFVLAPGLATVVLVGATLYGLLRWASYAPLRQASSEAIIWAARRDSHFLETLRGIKTIKLFNGQHDRRAHWLSLLVETINRQLKTQRLDLLFRTANTALLGLLVIIVIWLAAQMIMANAFSIGLLVAFLAYQQVFLQRVSDLIDTFVELRMLGLHAERLADIALTPPEPLGAVRPMMKTRQPVAIEVCNLSFRYAANDPWVLRNVSFRIDSGEWVAIAGPSGCGKTTLLKLLAGLLYPTEGTIYVNGEPLSRIPVEEWRAMIGVVMQDDSLFAGSIADNISFFAANPDHDHIEACARLASVHEDIFAMPMGYGTLIGDMGTVLSGGQKQRVLLARALYREPGLLLLDEATSHLDVTRERTVNATLQEMSVTRIVVAHRPETIEAARRVIVFEHGELCPTTFSKTVRDMRIKQKIIFYQAIIAIMLLSMAMAAHVAIDRINYYSERNRSTVEQMDTVIRLSAHMNRYSENIAELLLLGRTELDDFHAARSSLENDLAKLTRLAEQEVRFIRTAEEQAVAGEELVRAGTMRELFESIDLIVQRLLFLRDENRHPEAIQLFREQIEERLDAELEEHIAAAIADEEAEILFFEQRTQELQRRLTLLVSGVSLAALLISTIAGISLTRALTRPIRELISGTRAIGEGNLSYRIKNDREDEFADLAQQFNTTAAHLEEQRAQLLEVQAGLEKEVARRTSQLEDANARLQRLDQMRVLFLADIGHELRTPVTIMRGEAEVALRGKRTLEEYCETLEIIVQLSQQMGRLVEDLLFLARAELGAIRFEMQRLVLQDVLELAVREGRVLADGARLLLSATMPAEPYEIEGDAERLMQAFLIVIDNAVKHSDPDGPIELSLERDSGEARIAVSNTASAIAAHEIAYVFNRFYRGHRAVHRGTTGSGLGLPIAKWIVDAHGGRIAISSRESKTELTIHLPLAA